MKTLQFNSETYEADKIVKTDNNIVGYDLNDNEVFSFKGISDFTQFQLGEGQTFDTVVIEPLKVYVQTLDERTVGMQAIDDFTLQAQANIDDRTMGMQEIDDFTLQLVNDQATLIAQLQADVAQLKGGV